MKKLTQEEEKELLVFIKDWLKVHGYSQKDLANNLNIKSSRSTEIISKLKAIYKKGGIFNVAKTLIRIEQLWLNNSQNFLEETTEKQSYNQLDIDSLVNQINKESF